MSELQNDYDLTLKSIIAKNFMAYTDLNLNFENKDIVGVLAAYENDKTRSNRAGKSAILELIRYNLTGKSRAKTDKDLIHYGEKFMETICTYTDGVKDYVVRRGVDLKGKGLLEVNWITNIKEAQTEINKLFGTSPEDIDLTNFFKQADIMGFMGMEPAKKTAFLMSYIENQHWTEKEALANSDRSTVKQKIRDNDNIRSMLENGLEVDLSLEGMKSDLNVKADLLKKAIKLNAIEHARLKSEHKSAVDNKKLIIEKINKAKSNFESIELELKAAESNIEKISSLKIEIKKIEKFISDSASDRTIQIINSDKSTEQMRMATLSAQVQSASKNKGMCPIIKKECESITFSQEQITSFKKEIGKAEVNIGLFDEEIEQISELNESKTKLKLFEDRLHNLTENVRDIDKIKNKLTLEENEIRKLKLELNTLSNTDFSEKISEVSDSISEKESDLSDIQKSINGFDVRIQQSKNSKEKIDKLVSANESLKKELTLLNYTCYMFSKKGIPSGEIENAFGEIEEKINYCLENLSSGLSIAFSADRETNEKEQICSCGHEFEKGFKGKDCPECAEPRQYKRREEINFSVVEGDKEQNFELDSGGGKQIICYAVKIALTYFKRRMSKCRLNVLFLDEIDSALDPYLANQIISSVTNFLTTKLGFKQILMVSHKDQIKNSMPHIIKVIKHDTHSTARFI